jgi:hypothetical protein
MKVKDVMTATQYNLILSQMEECLLIDPADLLVEDRQLLDANFDQLNSWSHMGLIRMAGRNELSSGRGIPHLQRVSPCPPIMLLLWSISSDEDQT